MRGQDLVNKVRKAKKDFGPDYPKKFGGAAAVEILRAAHVNRMDAANPGKQEPRKR